jgi:hypothetical protein
LQSGVKGIANWWQEVNASPAWQENIFLGLAIAYAVIGLVALVSHLHPPPPPHHHHQHHYHRFFAPLDHLPPFIIALFLGLSYGLSLSLPLTEEVCFLVCSLLCCFRYPSIHALSLAKRKTRSGLQICESR